MNITPKETVGAIQLSTQLVPMVHEYLSGCNIDSLALKYNIDVTQVSEFLNKTEVKRFISTELKNYRYVNRRKRIELLSDMVDEALNIRKENELPMTDKDPVELLKLLQTEDKDIGTSDVEVEGGKQAYIQIINQLRAD